MILQSLAKIAVLASLFFYMKDKDIVKVDIFLFQISSIILLSCVFIGEKLRQIDMKPFFFFTIFLVFNLLTHQIASVGAHFFNTFFILSTAWVIATHCKETEKLGEVFVYAAALQLVVFALQKAGFNPFLNVGLMEGQEGGLMGNAPRLSTFLAIAMPFCPLWIFPAIAAFAILTKESALMLCMGVFLLLKLKGRWRLACGLTMLAAGVYLWPIIWQVSIANRIPIYKSTLDAIGQNPWIGFGLGSRPVVTSTYHGMLNEQILGSDFIMSSFLQIVFSMGLLAVYFILKSVVYVVKNFDRSDVDFAVLNIIILSVFKYPLEIHRLWISIAVIIGMYLAKQSTKEIA